ncbi:membrane protein [Burkholderia phage BcepF1]|uniref:Membrane protein n=1 Tax=Burkholderia phage BcepF1 TaxID=2886897 RepID=A1YZW0_9CAUD|nr:membrane protein [Burkholderia phage BcepF1]ABL96787.1 membrane protein [Burkholderia phage BcepF1]
MNVELLSAAYWAGVFTGFWTGAGLVLFGVVSIMYLEWGDKGKLK